MVTLTSKCNLKCKYCNMYRAVPKTLKSSDVLFILDKVKPLQIGFSGGEVLLERDTLFEILDGCKKRDLERIIITTNGTLLKKEDILKFESIGVTDLIISLDGLKRTHELIRGKGTFDQIFNGIKLIISNSNNINLTINTVVSPNNISEIPTLVESLYKLKVHTIELHPVKLKEGLLNLTKDIIKKRYMELWYKNNVSIIKSSFEKIFNLKTQFPTFIGNTIENLLLIKDYLINPTKKVNRKHCPVYKKVISLTYEGRVCFCLEQGDASFQFSNIDEIKEKGLEAVLNSAKTKKIIKKIQRCKEPCMCLTYHESLEEPHLR